MNRRKVLTLLGSLSAISVVVLLLWPASKPPVFKIRPANPSVISHKNVESFKLNLGGQSFGSQPIVATLGDEIKIEAAISLDAQKAPTGRFHTTLFIGFHPVGTPEEVWSKVNSAKSVHRGLLPKSGVQQGTVTLQLVPPKFAAGEYELRAYLVVVDSEGSRHLNDYLASARLRVTESGRTALNADQR